jgi:hypothetical protein
MTTIFRSLPKAAGAPLAASLITGFALLLGTLGQASAQQAASDMRRCQQLYDSWTHYVDTAANTRSATWGAALEDCRKGNTTAGIATLTRAFERAKMPLPPVESAVAR